MRFEQVIVAERGAVVTWDGSRGIVICTPTQIIRCALSVTPSSAADAAAMLEDLGEWKWVRKCELGNINLDNDEEME